MTWHAYWAKAQCTPAVASTMIWLVVTPVLPVWVNLVLLGAWAGGVAGWNSQILLWIRYGARPLNGFGRDLVLRALVPIESRRGRRQPTVWRSARLRGTAIAANSDDLVFADDLVNCIGHGQLSDLATSAIAVHAFGATPINGSRGVAAVHLFTLPWRLVVRLSGTLRGPFHRSALGRLCWHARWVVFLVAASDLYRTGQWVALGFLIATGIATITTPRWQTGWERRLEELGDHAVVQQGLGSALARLLARPNADLHSLERAQRLTTTVAGRKAAPASGRGQR
ncbi:MAG TPA: hypothetical protein PLB21_04795 [Actinomycetota bacterium]|nr:hypothetical protein [Actinomycetota bacterium]